MKRKKPLLARQIRFCFVLVLRKTDSTMSNLLMGIDTRLPFIRIWIDWIEFWRKSALT